MNTRFRCNEPCMMMMLSPTSYGLKKKNNFINMYNKALGPLSLSNRISSFNERENKYKPVHAYITKFHK